MPNKLASAEYGIVFCTKKSRKTETAPKVHKSTKTAHDLFLLPRKAELESCEKEAVMEHIHEDVSELVHTHAEVAKLMHIQEKVAELLHILYKQKLQD